MHETRRGVAGSLKGMVHAECVKQMWLMFYDVIHSLSRVCSLTVTVARRMAASFCNSMCPCTSLSFHSWSIILILISFCSIDHQVRGEKRQLGLVYDESEGEGGEDGAMDMDNREPTKASPPRRSLHVKKG